MNTLRYWILRDRCHVGWHNWTCDGRPCKQRARSTNVGKKAEQK